MSVLKNLKNMFSSKKKPDIFAAQSFDEFKEKVDYYILTNRKLHIPNSFQEESALYVFWMILYGLLRAEKVTMDESSLIGYSPLLDAHLDAKDLSVYFTFSDEAQNAFSYSVVTVKKSMETFSANGENGLTKEVIEEIASRKEVAENVKAMFLQLCDLIVQDKRWMISVVMNNLSFGSVFFDLLSNYIMDEEQPNLDFVDDMLYKKFLGAYGKFNITAFESMIVSKERDSICFVVSTLIVKNKCKFIEAYMLATRSMNFLNAILQWISGYSHVYRLVAVCSSPTSPPLDINDIIIGIMRRIASITMTKNLASSSQIFHILNDVVYFMDKIGAEQRAKMFCAMVITIHRNNEKAENQSRKINLEESFNMLLNVTEDQFLISVRDFLSTEESLYKLYDEYIYKLFKEPYENRMKYVKGHVALLMRDETVRLLESDPEINMDPHDMNSVPMQISRTLMLLPNDSCKKLHMVIGSGEKMINLLPAPEQHGKTLYIQNEDEDDVFENLVRNKMITGNNLENMENKTTAETIGTIGTTGTTETTGTTGTGRITT